MAEVDVPVFAVTLAGVACPLRVARNGPRGPLLRTGIWPIVRRVPHVLQKNVLRIFRDRGQRIAAKNCADDHEGMHLNRVPVRLLDEISKGIEGPAAAGIRLADAIDLGQRLLRIEIPRVASAPDLDEQRVGVTLNRDLDDAVDVAVRSEWSVEGIDPVGAVFVRAEGRRKK